MANQRTDTQSVINLVINGKQAMTSLRELTDTQRRLNSEIRNMRPGDPGYQRQLQQLQMINRALDEQRRQIRGADTDASKFKNTWKDIVGGVTAGSLLSDGISSIGSAISSFITGSQAAYAEAEKGQAQLAAVIKSTGEVAGRTKDQLNDMAAALMAKTGIDDDVINKSQAMLLTFTNVRNEMFDQSIPAIVDMTAAMNQGNVSMETIQATTIQVGKALNDPIKGMTALKKVGVTFSDDQKQVIKRLQETGNMAGAQAIILAELKKEFGGVAAAVANTESGALQKFNTRMGNIQESIGGMITKLKGGFASAFDPFVGWLEKVVSTPVSETLEDEQTELNGLVRGLVLANDSQEVRNSLIAELQQKYPDFLGNLKKESVDTDVLTRRLEAANEQYREKIQLAVNEEAIKEKQARYNKLIREEAEARKQVAAYTSMSATELAKLSEKEIKALAEKQALKDLENAKMAGGSSLGFSGGNSLTAKSGAENLRRLVDGVAEQKTIIVEINDLMGAGAVMQSKFTKLQIADIDKEIAALKNKKGVEKEIENLKLKRSKLDGTFKAPAIASGASGKGSDSAAKKEKATAEKLKEDLEKNAEEVYQNMLSKEDKELRAINVKYEKLRERAKGNKDQIVDLQNQEGDEVATLIRKQNAEEAELKKKNADEAAKIAKEKGEKIAQQYLDDQLFFYDNMTSDHQKEIDAVNDKYDKLFAIAEQYGMDMMDLELMWAAEINAIDDKPAKEKKKKTPEEQNLKNLEDYKKAALEVSQTIADTAFNIGAQKRQQETDEKLSALERQKQAELDNAEGNESAKAEINARYAQLEKAEKLRAWEANRKAAITQALINGALAATNIWATTPKIDFGVSTYIMLGISAASTIASVATIASAKPPEFASGVRGFEGGVAKVGEAGPELINEADKWWLIDGPTFANLAPGTDVYNATDTSKMLGDRMYQKNNYSINTGATSDDKSYKSTSTGQNLKSSSNPNVKSENSEIRELKQMVAELTQAMMYESKKPVVLDYNTKEEFEKKLQFDRSLQGG